MSPFLFALTLVAASHHGAGGSVASIDAACAAATGPDGKDRPRFFVEVSGTVLPKAREGHWRELATEAELRALSDGPHPPNTEAVVRGARGGTLVSMYFQDSSATWAHVVDYCFRAAGPLARVRGTFNSYLAVASGGPGIRRRRTLYCDAQGAVLQSKTGVFDLGTDEPLPKVQFLDEDDPLYRALRALPFADDLLPPVASDLDPSGLSAAVRERLPAVKACYQRAQKGSQRLAGKAVGHWTVDEQGKVSEFSWQSDEIKSAPFSTCARKVIESWRFPPRDTPVTVSFPFVFEGASSDVSLVP